jgi:hypothetical protein
VREYLVRETELNNSCHDHGRMQVPTKWWRPLARALLGGRLSVAVVLWLSVVVAGQQPDAGEVPEDPLAGVRDRASLGPPEDRAIDAWITAQLEELRAAPVAALLTATADFRAAFRAELDNPASSPQYLDRLAERTAAAAMREFGSGNDDDTAIDRALAWVLFDLERVSARDALLAGLRHPAEEVRYLAAKTYAKLRSAIAADSQLTRRVITQLGQAGAAESSPVVMGAVYQAVSYEQANYLDASLDAMAQVLDAVVQARQSGQRLRAGRAELEAFEFLLKVRTRIPQASRPRLVRQLAALLALDVGRYGQALPDERRDIQERIEVCESLLEALSEPGGDVRGVMKTGGPAVGEAMAGELLKWVGGQDQDGVLNKAPWGVPRGGLP